ncbi:MAG: hypothetical protein H0T69_07060 [Thermoleophilaceae bacterium]|nr:hypothetical protein [Thermoleophilaceae bacterium]
MGLGASVRQGDVGRAALRGPAERGLVLATGLAAALPVMAATVRELSVGWVPQSDQAVAAARAYDVFTSWTPLVGPWSSSSNTLGQPVYHLGPLLYWLLALPARLPGSAAFPLVMGVVNTAAVLGVVVLAHRRGGRPLMFAAAVAVAAMCGSLGIQPLSDIWSPSAPLLSFTLLIFVCWSVACGEPRLLPVAALLASFAVQSHLIFVLPALGLVAVALAGLVTPRLRGTTTPDGSLRRWSLVAVVVGLVCWSGPMLDQALSWAGSSRGTGNLATVVRAARSRESPVGADGGARAVASAVGVTPQWLRSPQSPTHRTFEIFAPVGAGRVISTLAVLGGLAAVLLVGIRRRRTDVVTAASLALILCAALAIDTASFPNTPATIFSYAYASWWAIPAGMFVWLALGWSAATLWAPRLRGRLPRRLPAGAGVGLGLGIVVIVSIVVVAGQSDDNARRLFGPTRTIEDGVAAALPHPGNVRVDAPTFVFKTGVMQTLRRHGGRVQTEDFVEFGRHYALRGGPVDHVVDIRQGLTPAPGGRVVAQVKVPPGQGTFTVSVR